MPAMQRAHVVELAFVNARDHFRDTRMQQTSATKIVRHLGLTSEESMKDLLEYIVVQLDAVAMVALTAGISDLTMTAAQGAYTSREHA